jgi:hypothetical protein
VKKEQGLVQIFEARLWGLGALVIIRMRWVRSGFNHKTVRVPMNQIGGCRLEDSACVVPQRSLWLATKRSLRGLPRRKEISPS